MPKGKIKYSSVKDGKPATGKKRPGASAKRKARKSMKKSSHGSSHSY